MRAQPAEWAAEHKHRRRRESKRAAGIARGAPFALKAAASSAVYSLVNCACGAGAVSHIGMDDVRPSSL